MTEENEKRYRVGIFGHFGNNNLGDEAIIWATIQNLRACIPGIELVGFSMKPDDTNKRFDIEAFPVRNLGNSVKTGEADRKEPNLTTANNGAHTKSKYHQIRNILASKIHKSSALGGFLYLGKNLGSEIRFLRKAKEHLERLDVLIICGSNQFLDNFGGPWGFPYTLLKWTLMAKSTATKVFFVSVGAGPLSNPLSYWMLKRTLRRSDYLSYRDNGSRKLIEDKIPNLNVSGAVYPDLAHGLKTVPGNGVSKKNMKIVAINPMPVFDRRYWYVNKPEKYEQYINNLAEFIKHVLNQGYAVNLFNHHPSDVRVIEDLLEHLQKMADVNVDNINIKCSETVKELVTTISEADIVVATRFHATVLPLRLGKPVLGVCYHRKSKELLEDVGLGDYYVDIGDFSSEELCNKFDSLTENIEKAKLELESRYERYTELLDEQWIKLADLIKS